MQSVDIGNVGLSGQRRKLEFITMPHILGPAGSRDIWSRLVGNLAGDKLIVDKQLYFDALPRGCIIDCPSGNSIRSNLCPTVKGWRREVYKRTYCKRTNDQGFSDGLADQKMRELV